MDERLYFQLDEIPKFYPVNVRTLRVWIAAGKLKASKIGRKWWVSKTEMARLIRDNEFKPFRPRSL